MHSKTILLSLFMACAVAAPALTPLEARAPPTQYEGTYDFWMTVPPCYPPSPDTEQVQFSVSWKGHYTITTDEQTSAVTVKGHRNEKGTGVGLTSGKKYQLSNMDNYDDTYTFNPPWDREYHVRKTYQIVKQGSGQVYKYGYNLYYSYDPDNGVVFRVEKPGESSCS
ncbi:uncharacterized protein BO97DRAFT_448722 [Aspergillus homomorphus CBS 101889]|uniref:Uncharacterized protein n=1 Tax=Aspergillus homomorphus (strain CBS 101889) TaxID=1450537 RepID=A0A395I1S3_ASPHC|nr:hypothetical protein BO97DRAFT_448722 [Aspergillus homomorphus CBS 101889]RAL14142.1 hypothetical protein BO97DRAFT_448722 [Aspergillus homomorphus CBS 101889]